MRTYFMQGIKRDFIQIFNLQDEEAKGRVISLCSVVLTAVYNVFITGLFYTGFLSMYGMSITDAGIVTFIPFIGNLFSIFSSKILCHFKRRKPVLIAAKIFFYAMYILATTIMPLFVEDPHARLMWFIGILFVAHAVYAPFATGFTVWFYHFYPADNERRSKYLMVQQAFSTVMSSLVLIFSSVLTDAVAGSPHQHEMILGLRYLAFALVMVEIAIQARAKEFIPADENALQLRQVFTLPFRYRKFLNCMLFMFAWNFIANLPNGVWNYHLLNHMHFSYTLINAMSLMYTVLFLLLSNVWRRIIRRHSWIRAFGYALLFWVPTEIFFFSMTTDRAFLYVPLCLVQNILSVGLNLSYANILYMNLPEENATVHIAFNTIGCNVFAFLGLLTSTWISSLTGDQTMTLLGMQVYSVQLNCLLRAVTMLTMGIVLVCKWRVFTPQRDIEEIDSCRRVRRPRSA